MISALFFILFFLLAHTHRPAVFSEIFSRYFFRKPFKLFHSVFGGGFFAACQIIPVPVSYTHLDEAKAIYNSDSEFTKNRP